jgi:hypothetical protein
MTDAGDGRREGTPWWMFAGSRSGGSEFAVSLDELAREGARRMIATALEAEVAEHIERLAGVRGEDGRRLVVRDGHARERRLAVGRAPSRCARRA